MTKPIILTGDRPTGKLHIGHYVGSLKNRVLLQEEDKYDMFVFLADQQALTDHAKDPQTIVESIILQLDWIQVNQLSLFKVRFQSWLNYLCTI